MLRDHVAISQEVVSYDCPKCLSGGVCFVGMFVNGFRPMSRREQRRARKAAKNLVMYKTYGRRQWTNAHHADVLRLPRSWRRASPGHDAIMRDLRRPSGFVLMSRLADFIKNADGHVEVVRGDK